MRFINTTQHNKIEEITKFLNKVWDSTEFWMLIKNVKQFDMSYDSSGKVTGEEMVDIIKQNTIVASIVLYRPWWRWSKVNGYCQGGKTIYINSRRLWRSEKDIANTISHEYVHLLDNFVPAYVGHGDNSPNGKLDTAPWKIGRIIEKIWDVSRTHDGRENQNVLNANS